jgi:hypothetical protein
VTRSNEIGSQADAGVSRRTSDQVRDCYSCSHLAFGLLTVRMLCMCSSLTLSS